MGTRMAATGEATARVAMALPPQTLGPLIDVVMLVAVLMDKGGQRENHVLLKGGQSHSLALLGAHQGSTSRSY